MSYSDEINILLLDEYNIGDEFILDIWDEDIIDQDVAHIIYHARLNTIYGGLDDQPIYQFIINNSTDIGSVTSYINMDTSSEIIMRTHKLYSIDYSPPQYKRITKNRPHLYRLPRIRHGGRTTRKGKISKKKKRKSIRKRKYGKRNQIK